MNKINLTDPITPEWIESNRGHPDAEIQKDIEDTEREIQEHKAHMEKLEAAIAYCKIAIQDRELFISKLRALQEARKLAEEE